MTRNVGAVGRAARMAAGTFLLVLPVAPSSNMGPSLAWAYAIGALGAVLLLTGIFGLCPLHRLLGVDTRDA